MPQEKKPESTNAPSKATKLQLNKETVKNLDPRASSQVKGGARKPGDTYQPETACC